MKINNATIVVQMYIPKLTYKCINNANFHKFHGKEFKISINKNMHHKKISTQT